MTQPPLAETLQLHEGLVRGLARGVLGLDDRVDDVVQETWRAALEHGPREPSRLRGWLAAVARNRALSILRRDEVRRRHERSLPRRDPTSPAAEIAAREETRRRLVEALLGQPEPYRTTLLLRYYEDCSVKEIARRMEVSRETAKTRLRRGLARLRQGLGGQDEKALALLVPLAFARRAAPILTGVLLMGTKTKIAIGVAVLIGATAFVASRALPERAAARAESGVRTETTIADAADTSESAAPEPLVDAATPPRADAEGLTLRGRLESGGARVGGEARITVVPVTEVSGLDDISLEKAGTADGAFSIDLEPLLHRKRPPQLEVRVDHPNFMVKTTRIDLPPAASPELLVVDLAPAAIATGTVFRPDGTTGPGARVALYRAGDAGPAKGAVDRTEVDADGRYRLRAAADGVYWIAAWDDGSRPASATVDLRVSHEQEAPPLPLLEGVTITGRLRVNGEPPPPGATVSANRRVGKWIDNLVWEGGVAEHGRIDVTPDPDGAFTIRGLAAGAYGVRCAKLPGCHMSVYQIGSIDVGAPAAAIEIDLKRTQLEVKIEGDAPIVTIGIYGDGLWYGTTRTGVHSAWLRPGLEYVIEAQADGFEKTTKKVTIDPGPKRTVSIRLQRKAGQATLKLSLRTTDAPPESIAVGLYPEGATEDYPPIRRRAKRGDAGLYIVGELKPGRYRVLVRAGESWFGALGYLQDAEAPAVLTANATTELEFAMLAGGRLRLTAKAPDGRDLHARCVLKGADGKRVPVYYISRGAGGFMGTADDVSGLSEVAAALPSGRYTAEFSADGYETRVVALEVEAGKTTEHEVTLPRK